VRRRSILRLAVLAFSVLAALAVLATCALRLPEPTGPWRGAIAFSFDDGPNPDVTEDLLDVLDRHGVRAWFCLIGENVRASEEHRRLTREIAARGHAVVVHGDSETWAWRLWTAGAVAGEIARCDETLTEVVGAAAVSDWYRPAGGWLWPWQRGAVERSGKRLLPLHAFWFDTSGVPDAERVATLRERGFDAIDAGNVGMVVLHDGLDAQSRHRDRDVAGTRYDRSFVPGLVDELIRRAKERGLAIRGPRD
jgi:peptidoglycan/xylan/chitin deacetylase (PgdA/CDA1 family)